MHASTRRDPQTRARALRRLSRLRTGAAVVGVVGSVAFAGLAAMTYDGTSAGTTAAASTATTPAATPVPLTADDTTGSSSFGSVPAPVTTTPGSGHASTGGS